jgi:hypothetical protein
VPTRLNVTQQYDAPASEVFALFSDQEFVEARLEDAGGLDAKVVSLDVTDDGVKIVTRQSIPASALPSMVASMIPGDPATERVEEWTATGDTGYSAQFSVIVKGAPATLKGTMNLVDAGAGSTLTVDGTAAVPIPLFGGKIEGVIVEQVTSLLKSEEAFTRTELAG